MRAKRSKKYRKIMSAYGLHFSFRTPYQVLCDSDFVRTCHDFKMPIQKFLENTLHGESRPYLTNCSLARITEVHEQKVKKGQELRRGRGDGRPEWLPLPTEVPLRHCKHKDEQGNDRGRISEAECLIDLVSGQVQGNEVPRNKQHYVLATAESEAEKEGRRRKGIDVRAGARLVPGVPIVYVKRSVMILEELSASSERLIRGIEKGKFTEGLIGNVKNLKRKRDGDDLESDSDADKPQSQGPKVRGLKRAKGPNPLSVKKKKNAPQLSKPKSVLSTNVQQEAPQTLSEPQNEAQPKKKSRRIRGKKKKGEKADAESTETVEKRDSQVLDQD